MPGLTKVGAYSPVSTASHEGLSSRGNNSATAFFARFHERHKSLFHTPGTSHISKGFQSMHHSRFELYRRCDKVPPCQSCRYPSFSLELYLQSLPLLYEQQSLAGFPCTAGKT